MDVPEYDSEITVCDSVGRHKPYRLSRTDESREGSSSLPILLADILIGS
jgi:hypothetical protein